MSVSSLENQYCQVLAEPKNGVSEKARPWFFKHVANWSSHCESTEFPSKREATEDFFKQLGGDARLAQWQFRQSVRAVELWNTDVLKEEWSADFDWQGLIDEARVLEEKHATRLRDSTPSPLLEFPPSAKDRIPVENENEIVNDLVGVFTNVIRKRNLAYETEKSYCDTLRRYIYFSLRRLGRSPIDRTLENIELFLDCLALERHLSVSSQKKHLCALVFFCRYQLNLDNIELNFVRTSNG